MALEGERGGQGERERESREEKKRDQYRNELFIRITTRTRRKRILSSEFNRADGTVEAFKEPESFPS